jgi:hypothetical protein
MKLANLQLQVQELQQELMEFGRRQELVHQKMQEVLEHVRKTDASLDEFRRRYFN